LTADSPLPEAWLRALPDVGSLSPRVRRWYLGAATASIVILGGLWGFGDALLTAAAPLLPHRMLVRLGDGMVRELGGDSCTAPAGTAALTKLTARLTPARGFIEPVKVTVLNTAAVNALAAPGGRVVLFRGLIDKAHSPDEVAGVLAHEFTHVALRHPAQALLRQMGLSLLVQAIGGLHGSRRAEAAADAGAITQLRASHISPAGLAAFFVRIRDEDRAKPKDATRQVVDEVTSFAATHPGDTERAGLVAAAVARQGAVTPALDAADWQALRAICE